MNSRCVFVYCDVLKKGFVTRLTQDQRLEKVYEQVNDIFLSGSDYEVVTVELSDEIASVDWILPPFLRIKDLHFENPLYTRATVQRKRNGSVTPFIRPMLQLHESTKPPIKPRARSSTVKPAEAATEEKEIEEGVKKESEEKVKKAPSKKRIDQHEDGENSAGVVAEASPGNRAAKKTENKESGEVKSKKRSAKSKSSGAQQESPQVTPEPATKKQKLKQATLTPGGNAAEVETTPVEQKSEEAGKRVKTVSTSKNAVQEVEKKPTEDAEESSSVASTTDASSSSEVTD